MNQQRLNAYLNLIQGLLSCPHGEEWTLLQQDEELVNPEFVQVMEQVATQLAAEGKLEAAQFLRHWAAQLNHVLEQAVKDHSDDKYQAYLQLIQALLDCPKGSEVDILAANQELVDLNLVQIMKQVANQIAAQGNREAARYLSNLAAELSRKLMPSRVSKPHPEQDTKVADLAKDEQLKRLEQLLRKSPEQPQATQPNTTPVNNTEVALPPPPKETTNNQQLEERLAKIAESLAKLEQILASRLQPPDPLWYMNVLERAHASHWILTTEEVEQLIGVKPQCKAGEDSYQRGCWVFVKAGKMGLQTGWHVLKDVKSE
jgi:hypothetical protein